MKPVYPEILTADNTLAITDNGDGTITINPNQEFLIQDVKINTSNITNRTFTINPSTTYHLRFSLNGTPINNYTPQPLSFYLVDVNDTNYNPNSVAETDTQFDTKYDDMLVAKIESDGNNTITITSLKNKRVLKLEGTVIITAKYYPYEIVNNGAPPITDLNNVYPVSLYWSRRGKFIWCAITDRGGNVSSAGYGWNEGGYFKNRYLAIMCYQHYGDPTEWANITYILEA